MASLWVVAWDEKEPRMDGCLAVLWEGSWAERLVGPWEGLWADYLGVLWEGS